MLISILFILLFSENNLLACSREEESEEKPNIRPKPNYLLKQKIESAIAVLQEDDISELLAILNSTSPPPVRTYDTPPHIVFIMADDLGWNDVGWHNPEMPTPVLDSLVRNHSAVLNQSYVLQLCSPTRSAFLSGLYPFRTGTQHLTFKPMEPSGLPTKFKLFPQDLQKSGYRTYMVGKWHLGYCKKEYLPTSRGFHYYFGGWQGGKDHFSHVRTEKNGFDQYKGFDLWEQERAVWDYQGHYSAEIFADKSAHLIAKHNKSLPMFLLLSFNAVHKPIKAPEIYKVKCKQKAKIKKDYCGMVNAMDSAIGKVINALKSSDMYKNSIIIFSTDNGANGNSGGSNYPLRGYKGTLWEGGTRALSFVHSPKLFPNGGYRERNDLFHIVDWYATIMAMAGAPVVSHGDGINQLNMIVNGVKGDRFMIIYSLDSDFKNPNLVPESRILGNGGFAIRVEKYKLIWGFAGRSHYRVDEVGFNNDAKLIAPRLFNLKADPTERRNLANRKRRLLNRLKGIVNVLRSKIEENVHKPINYLKGAPNKHNGTFGTGWCK